MSALVKFQHPLILLTNRTCRANAESAHSLYHWRFNLNEWVFDYLKRMGHMDDEEVLRRNKMKQKYKTRNAIAAIEKMKETNEIDKLWRDFHTILKAAREEQKVCSHISLDYLTRY